MNWLAMIRKEQIDKQKRQAEEKKKRAERLKALLDTDSEDEETIDYKAIAGDNLNDFLSKVQRHVDAE